MPEDKADELSELEALLRDELARCDARHTQIESVLADVVRERVASAPEEVHRAIPASGGDATPDRPIRPFVWPTDDKPRLKLPLGALDLQDIAGAVKSAAARLGGSNSGGPAPAVSVDVTMPIDPAGLERDHEALRSAAQRAARLRRADLRNGAGAVAGIALGAVAMALVLQAPHHSPAPGRLAAMRAVAAPAVDHEFITPRRKQELLSPGVPVQLARAIGLAGRRDPGTHEPRVEIAALPAAPRAYVPHTAAIRRSVRASERAAHARRLLLATDEQAPAIVPASFRSGAASYQHSRFHIAAYVRPAAHSSAGYRAVRLTDRQDRVSNSSAPSAQDGRTVTNASYQTYSPGGGDAGEDGGSVVSVHRHAVEVASQREPRLPYGNYDDRIRNDFAIGSR